MSKITAIEVQKKDKERYSLFEFIEGTDAPRMEQVQYTFAYEDVSAEFGRWENGFLLILISKETSLRLQIANIVFRKRKSIIFVTTLKKWSLTPPFSPM